MNEKQEVEAIEEQLLARQAHRKMRTVMDAATFFYFNAAQLKEAKLWQQLSATHSRGARQTMGIES